MPATWTFDASAGAHLFPAAAVAGLLDVASAPLSAERLLRAIEPMVPVEHLSLVTFRHHKPELIEGFSAHTRDRNVVAECFAIYRRSYFRSDAVMCLAEQVAHRPAREVAVLHCRAYELPVAGWRGDSLVCERPPERTCMQPPHGTG